MGETPGERVVLWLRRHRTALDAVLAAVLLLVSLLQVAGHGSPAQLCVVGLAVPLAWRRTRPVPAAAVVTLAGLAQLLVSPTVLLVDVAPLLMVYALTAYAPRWAGAVGLGLGLVGAALFAVAYAGGSDLTAVAVVALIGALAVLLAWALGFGQRVRLLQAGQLAERARLLEAERDSETRLAATAERQRIAREMHDVVAHSLSVIVAQADGGRYAARTDPSLATGALETIAATGRQALDDMRGLLGVLRDGPGDARTPQPDAGRIAALVDDVRGAGLPVELEEVGQPRPLSSGAGLAAYRIVQEALTNVLKHAGPVSRARVQVRWTDTALALQVLDDGRGAAAAAPAVPGQGVAGMRERARLHGGQLSAAPRSGGGFEVRARLPYRTVP